MKKKKTITIGYIIEFSLMLLLVFFTEISNLTIDFSWVNNWSIWLNHFIVSSFGYFVAKSMLFKIKPSFLRELISFLFALFFSQSLFFSFDTQPLTTRDLIVTIISCLIMILVCVLSGINGYVSMDKKIKKETVLYNNLFDEIVKNAPSDFKCKLGNCERLIKKYPEEIEMIIRFSPNGILEFMNRSRELKKERKIKSLN